MLTRARQLHLRVLDYLDDAIVDHSNPAHRPLYLELLHPLPHRVRLYIYTLTHPPGGRTTGEHKIQIIIPGQRKGERKEFDHSGGWFVLLAGYAPDMDVVAFWDARLYKNIPHSRNVQIKAETVYAAYALSIATQARRLWNGQDELIVACDRSGLKRAIAQRFALASAAS